MLKYKPVRPGRYTEPGPWYDRLYWRTYRFIRWEMRYWHKDIAYGVRNLWHWLPVIWRDRNWDYGYLLDIMILKLTLMRPAIRQHSAPQPCHQELNRCIKLLKEFRKRSNCDCNMLGTKRCGSKNMKAYLKCIHEQEQMMQEFGDILARNIQKWSD